MNVRKSQVDLQRTFKDLHEKIKKHVLVQISIGECKRFEASGAELVEILTVEADNELKFVESVVGKFTYRDLRQALSVGNRASIQVRKHVVCLSFFPVIAFVRHDRVYLLVTDVPRMDTLIQHILDPKKEEQEGDIPFELRAYDTLFTYALDLLREDIEALEGEYETLRKNFENKKINPTVSLTKLGEIEKQLKEFNARVTGLDKSIDQIIEDDEDLSRMELSRHFKDPSLYEKQIAGKPSADMDILVEYCDRELDGLTGRIKQLDEEIKSTERLFTLRIGILRNRILQVDLYASMIQLGIGFGTCLSGIFGMNLLSSLEEKDHMFNTISVVVAILVGLSTVAIGWLRWGVGI